MPMESRSPSPPAWRGRVEQNPVLLPEPGAEVTPVDKFVEAHQRNDTHGDPAPHADDNMVIEICLYFTTAGYIDLQAARDVAARLHRAFSSDHFDCGCDFTDAALGCRRPLRAMADWLQDLRMGPLQHRLICQIKANSNP